MAPFYGWGSTALRLEPLPGGSLKHKIMKKLEKSCKTYAAYLNIFLDLIFCKKVYKSKYMAMFD